MKLTRDSALLKVITLLSLLTAGVATAITNPAEYGLTAVSVKWIGMASTLLGITSAWLSTSWLPGENDDKRVGGGPSGRGDHNLWFLPILLAGSIVATSCAGLTPAPVVTQPTADQVQQVRATAVEIAKAVESVGQLVVEARRATGAAYDAGLITREQRNAVYQAVIDLEPRAHAVIDIAATVTTDPQLRSTVKALMGVMDGLLARLAEGNPAMATVAASIRAALDVAVIYLGGGR